MNEAIVIDAAEALSDENGRFLSSPEAIISKSEKKTRKTCKN